MIDDFYKEALLAYAGNTDGFIIQPLDGGLINHSYKITGEKTGESFLLQRINHNVFKKPENVQLNYLILWKHLKSSGASFYIPQPKYFPDGADLYWDRNRSYWRVFEFIEDGQMFSNAETIEQAKETARTFAELTAAFTDFKVSLLKDPIPQFHNLAFRYQQFSDSLKSNLTERMQKAGLLIEDLIERRRYVEFYDSLSDSEDYPKRVMHHDAKIANILFSKTTGNVICPVDFDTTMAGFFFSDLGDMIRSMACSHDENSTDFENITIRKDFYDTIMEGYLSVMEKQLTSAERKHIHYPGLLIVYMQALRFITDYLNGDIYYKTNYPEQNFDRAKNQLALLRSLEEITS